MGLLVWLVKTRAASEKACSEIRESRASGLLLGRRRTKGTRSKGHQFDRCVRVYEGTMVCRNNCYAYAPGGWRGEAAATDRPLRCRAEWLGTGKTAWGLILC